MEACATGSASSASFDSYQCADTDCAEIYNRFFTLNGYQHQPLHTTCSLPILNQTQRSVHRNTLTTMNSVDALDNTDHRNSIHVTFDVHPGDEEEEADNVPPLCNNYANVTIYGSDNEDDDQNNHSSPSSPFPMQRRRMSPTQGSQKRRSSRRLSVMDFRRDHSVRSKGSKSSTRSRRKSSVFVR